MKQIFSHSKSESLASAASEDQWAISNRSTLTSSERSMPESDSRQSEDKQSETSKTNTESVADKVDEQQPKEEIEEENKAAKFIQNNWRNKRQLSQQVQSKQQKIETFRRKRAAKKIQREWRGYLNGTGQDEVNEYLPKNTISEAKKLCRKCSNAKKKSNKV